MTYLLDVNALLALGVRDHEFHERTAKWVKKAVADQSVFATCAITELGFLRVFFHVSRARFTLQQAQTLLNRLKSAKELAFQFLVDDQGAADLPQWVRWPKQLTDGHLVALANAHAAILATLDESIRGAFVIPR